MLTQSNKRFCARSLRLLLIENYIYSFETPSCVEISAWSLSADFLHHHLLTSNRAYIAGSKFLSTTCTTSVTLPTKIIVLSSHIKRSNLQALPYHRSLVKPSPLSTSSTFIIIPYTSLYQCIKQSLLFASHELFYMIFMWLTQSALQISQFLYCEHNHVSKPQNLVFWIRCTVTLRSTFIFGNNNCFIQYFWQAAKPFCVHCSLTVLSTTPAKQNKTFPIFIRQIRWYATSQMCHLWHMQLIVSCNIKLIPRSTK